MIDELNTLWEQRVSGIAARLSKTVCRAHAVEVLSRWEGFGRFCRQTLGLEPMVLMRGFGLKYSDVEAEIRAARPDARIDEAVAGAWAARWRRMWERRFGMK